MERQKYNKLILEILSKLVEKYPDLRFGQILANAEVIIYKNDYDETVPIDPFYEEPNETLKRMANNRNVELLLNKENLEYLLNRENLVVI